MLHNPLKQQETHKQTAKSKTAKHVDFSLAPETGERRTCSASVRQSIKADLQEVADTVGLTEHAVTKYALRFFLVHYRQGTSHIEKYTKPPEVKRATLHFGDE